MKPRRVASARWFALAPRLTFVSLLVLLASSPAHAWDARVHKLITRLAITALPAGPMRTGFEAQSAQLQEFAIEPDTVLRPMYGQAEGRRHYIDLENFGPEPFAQLTPDFAAMERKFGAAMFDRSGTLPWAIEDEAAAMRGSWRSGDCDGMIRHAGYLAHYVGDASQPLHTTRYYDGYTRADRGEHARLESSADYHVGEIEALAQGQAQASAIDSVWEAITPELKQSNLLVAQLAQNDRAARAATGGDRAAYGAALMRSEERLIVHQMIDAASVLASVWLFEYQQAGKPIDCLGAEARSSS